MTLLVRDAETLLPANIAFHLAQGVDFFVITDNASVDRTGEIARGYERMGLAEVIDEPGDDYSQSEWVTRMARRAAAAHGADWVINSDDDEFWHAPGGEGLKSVLAGVSPFRTGVRAQRCNHPPLAGRPTNFDAMIYREACSLSTLGGRLAPKLVHRGFPDIVVEQGNVRARLYGAPLATPTHPGLRIEHFPVRDYAAFERKIRNGGAAYARNTRLDPSVGKSWRDLHALWQAGGLRDWYERQTIDAGQLAAGLAAGTLIRDETVLLALGGWEDKRVSAARG